MAAAMAANPDQSIPQLFARPDDVKATDEFFKRPEATPDNRHAGHREWVIEQMQPPGRYVLPEDPSEMTWPGHEPVRGRGPIGTGAEGWQGVHRPTTLAGRWRMEPSETDQWSGRAAVHVLGVADQQYQVRPPRPDGEKKNDSKATKRRDRESPWWEQAGVAMGAAPDREDVQWIRVGDRGADIYQMLVRCQELNHRLVIRAAPDRGLTDEPGRANLGQLWATARAQAPLGQFPMELRARPGQPARTAQMKIRAMAVWRRSPQRPGQGAGYLPPIRCTVVRVWEENAPVGVEALE